MANESGGGSWLRFCGYVLLFSAYVLVPLAITGVMAFSDDNIIRFPVRGYSLRWFSEFASNQQWINAAINSLEIATMTAGMSMALALPAAYALASSYRVRRIWQTVLLVPLFVPAVVLGISMAIGFGGVTLFGAQLYGSSFLVACAHTLWALPLVISAVLEPSFSAIDRSVVEAAGGWRVADPCFFRRHAAAGHDRRGLGDALCLHHVAQRIHHGAVPDHARHADLACAAVAVAQVERLSPTCRRFLRAGRVGLRNDRPGLCLVRLLAATAPSRQHGCLNSQP